MFKKTIIGLGWIFVLGVVTGTFIGIMQWLLHSFFGANALSIGGSICASLVIMWCSWVQLVEYEKLRTHVPAYILPFTIYAGFAGFYLVDPYELHRHLLVITILAALCSFGTFIRAYGTPYLVYNSGRYATKRKHT